MSVFHNNALIGAGGGAGAAAEAAVATKSLRFNSGDSAFLNRTPSSSGNRKTFTFSAWVKRTVLVAGNSPNKEIFIVVGSSNTTHFQLGFRADKLYVANLDTLLRVTNAVFRDTSAWYHIVLAVDTTQSTADDRIKLYVNGSQITSFSSSSNPSQNSDTGVNHTQQHNIGKEDHYFDGYMADIYLIDGSALDPTSFGAYDSSGVWQAAAYSGTYGTNGFHLAFGDSTDNTALGTDSSGNNNTFTVNNLAAYAPGLSTADQGFGILTYTGNQTARNISGLSFAPDLVIIKSRSDNNYNHYWVDRVRGAGKNLYSNLTESEHVADRLSSFNSDGIGLTNHLGVNKTGSNFVAWCWKAGGSASSNTNGTITSSVSASTTYGFSVVAYTGNNTSGATVGHGLSSAPKWVVVKSRGQEGQFWHVYHASLAANEYIYLNSGNAKTSGNDFMNGTRPTSSVFTLGNGNGCNKSSDDVIAYCWSEVSGFSKFDSYTGTSSTVTVVTGFKPKMVLVKNTTTSSLDWVIVDSERSNADAKLFPNTGAAESAQDAFDFNSDGFTIKVVDHPMNKDGDTFIYAAFADVPDDSDIDSLFDVPTNDTTNTDSGAGGEVSGNYAVINALNAGSNSSLTDGNLKWTRTSNGYSMGLATIGVSSGKWYYEHTFTGSQNNAIAVGIVPVDDTSSYPGQSSNSVGYNFNGTKVIGTTQTSYGATYDDGDVVGVAFDANSGTVIFYKNGVNQGVATSSLSSGPYTAAVSAWGNGTGSIMNFGQRAFVYSLVQSDLVSGPIAGSPNDATAMFDGSTSTFTDHSSTNSTITYNNTLTGVTSLKVYIHQGNSTGTVTTVGANGTQTDTISADFGPAYHTISLSSTGSTIHSIAFTRGGSGNFLSIYAIEVNGVVLTDSTATGFKTLNTSSLSTPTIADGSDHFYALTSTGTFGGGTVTDSDANFTPDLVWVKRRNAAERHKLYDILRGTDGTRYKHLESDGNDAEGSGETGITAFVAGGYTSEGGGHINSAGQPFISWMWNAGTSTASNTDGSVTSSVRANPSAGFSIVKYALSGSSAQTIGHGLNSSLGLLITKATGTTNGWAIWHSAFSNTQGIAFTTGAVGTQTWWDQSNMTNSVFAHKAGTTSSQGGDIIAYCFAPVSGYSSALSWDGNGSSDGVFIHTGFRVAWFLWKRSNGTANWYIYDSARSTINVVNDNLEPNTADAENTLTSMNVDFLSNGIKVRGSDGDINGSGGEYIGFAYAENPFQANGGLAR